MIHIKRAPQKVDAPPKKTIHAEFYKSGAGNEPVREFLKNDLTYDERKLVAEDIRTVEYGWPIGMPVCKDLNRSGLLEVRTRLAKKIVRILFIIVGSRMVLIHAFVKKDTKTPKIDFETAEERLKDLEQRNEKARKRR